MNRFFVKHYIGDERPTIKGNGFDGLEVGKTRDEAEDFIARVNELIDACRAIDAFFVFFDSHIPPNFGEGARDALMMVKKALRS